MFERADRDIDFPASTEALAARWFSKSRSGSMTVAEQRQLDTWLHQDPNNKLCFDRCETIVSLTNQLQDDPDLLPYFEDCARLGSSDRRRGFASWNAALCMRLSIAAMLIVVVGIAFYFTRGESQLYETAIGEQRTVALQDGSSITLNTDTSLSVAFSRGHRRVEISRGEAYFSVAKDVTRPFEVWTGIGMARAIGTEFAVTVRSTGTTVSVLSGRVAVAANAIDDIDAQILLGPVLSPNQSITYTSTGAMGEIREADVRGIEGWRTGKLNFDNLPLHLALEEFNRYTTRKVVLASPSIGELLVSGVLDIGDVDSLVLLLRESINLVVVEQNGRLIVRERIERR